MSIGVLSSYKKNYLCKKSLKRMIKKIKYEEITFYLNAYQHSQ